MIVTRENFQHCISELKLERTPAVDTETTGLRPYHSHRLFSVIISSAEKSYYFNFNEEPDHLGVETPHLRRANILSIVDLLSTRDLLFMANAKFDMAMIEKEYGLDIKWPEIHDVLVMERLFRNDEFSYSLDNVAKRHGFEKSDAVMEYIKEHKLWESVIIPGRRIKFKNLYFNKVPFEIMYTYGCRDGEITRKIGMNQLELLEDYFQTSWKAPFSPVEIERRITKILYAMEREGLDLDIKECSHRALEHTKIYEEISRRFHDFTRSKLIDSAKVLGPLFVSVGFTPPKTEKENDSITDEWLERLDHPLAKMISEYREHSKLANTFYNNYLYHVSNDGKIHANINQAGTATGRLSYSNPNLQQAPASKVRQVFVAEDKHCLVSIDWSQQEYKMMLDYAEQMDLIEEIKKGHDVHTATASLTGVDRKAAKTLNFMLLYGGGVVKLASALFPVTASEPILWAIWRKFNKWKVKPEDMKLEPLVTPEIEAENLPLLLKARGLRETYFEKLPKVQELIELCKTTARDRGYIKTWTGRRLYFKPEFSYKAPNALIQGGASDVAKISMIGIDKKLEGRKSKLLVQIHDEFIFKIHESELAIVPELREVMETTFPSRHLGLTTSIEHSWKNLYDMTEGFPSEETRDKVQGESSGGFKDPSPNMVF